MENTTGLIRDEGNEQDWILEGLDNDVIGKITALQMNDNIDFIYSQNLHKRHGTSCTKFAPINAMGVNKNKERTLEEIDLLEDLSLKLGRPGFPNGRSRSQGVNTLVKYWNNKNKEEDHVVSFVSDINSDKRQSLMDKGFTCVVSIRVGYDFIKDTVLGGIRDIYTDKKFGHATCVRWKDGQYEFIDSAFGDTSKPARHGYYTCKKEIFDAMIKNGNIQSTCHIILSKNNIIMIAQDVPAGQYYSEAVQRAIDNGITTATKNTKFNPHENIKRADNVLMMKRQNDKMMFIIDTLTEKILELSKEVEELSKR